MRCDYRALAALLRDAGVLRRAIELTEVPHFTTCQKASRRRLQFDRARRLLHETARRAIGRRLVRRTVPLAALDVAGLESHHASAYPVRRAAQGGNSTQHTTYARFPKLAAC